MNYLTERADNLAALLYATYCLGLRHGADQPDATLPTWQMYSTDARNAATVAEFRKLACKALAKLGVPT